MNALALKARWRSPFESQRLTRLAPFTVLQVLFMETPPPVGLWPAEADQAHTTGLDETCRHQSNYAARDHTDR